MGQEEQAAKDERAELVGFYKSWPCDREDFEMMARLAASAVITTSQQDWNLGWLDLAKKRLTGLSAVGASAEGASCGCTAVCLVCAFEACEASAWRADCRVLLVAAASAVLNDLEEERNRCIR